MSINHTATVSINYTISIFLNAATILWDPYNKEFFALSQASAAM
jgi:hypothetical protein